MTPSTVARLRACAAEAVLLGAFMVSACAFAALLWADGSPAAAAIPDGVARRAVMGAAMGATALVLLHSPLARTSGAHMNPAVSFAFWRLGRIAGADAAAYTAAQFAGGVAGVWLCASLAGDAVTAPPVRCAATVPGPAGSAAALLCETAMTAALFGAVLATSRLRPRAVPYVAAALLAAFITFLAPISGTSLNPARTFASAIVSGEWDAFWVYAAGPLCGTWIGAAIAAGADAAKGCCSVCAGGGSGCEIPSCTCRAAADARRTEVAPCPNATT